MAAHILGALSKLGCSVSAATAQVLLAPAPVGVQTTTSYGMEFSTITRPGNRNTTPEETFFSRIGGVPYEYRIARTELTVKDYYEFAQVYVRWHPELRFDNDFLGGSLYGVSTGGIVVAPGSNLNSGVGVAWRYAARLCNWLHNDKADAPWAFESGAYDTSTFTRNADGTINDQVTRSTGARYWIPSRNEWVKAGYFDLNKNGVGQEGYWQFPTRSDEIAISGLPWEGGQTSGGPNVPITPGIRLDVGAYANVQSPWGLFDQSGSLKEWIEEYAPIVGANSRYLRGSEYFDPIWGSHDRLDTSSETFRTATGGALGGLRLASVVPTPSTAFALSMLAVYSQRRRRH